jgi:RNA polymerase sigma-70 factor (ECF subfamily)
MSATVPAFHEIYAMFHPKMVRYLSNLLGEDDAEDLAQIVFLKVHEGLKDFRGEAKLSTWIYRIATNVAADRARSASFRERPHFDPDLLTVAGAGDTNIWTDEKSPDVDQELIRQEMTACIRSIVEQLPENSRAVILLSEFEGLKNGEIADILGITLDTVKIRLVRGRAKLREELQNQCTFHRDERNELACDRKGCSC